MKRYRSFSLLIAFFVLIFSLSRLLAEENFLLIDDATNEIMCELGPHKEMQQAIKIAQLSAWLVMRQATDSGLWYLLKENL